MKLIIGNKNYSSWSLRAWLFLSVNEVPFQEIRIPLSQENTKAEILKHSKSGKVPALQDNDLIVWDSIAICEYVSEKYLNGSGWPADTEMRAIARSCSAEMHSGFFSLREQMPMNCRASGRKVELTEDLQKDIERIDSIWSFLRQRYFDGPWLFGDFSIADCMFAPVVFRFNTYGPEVSDLSRKYMKTVLEHPKTKLWVEQAKAEKETIEYAEVGVG